MPRTASPKAAAKQGPATDSGIARRRAAAKDDSNPAYLARRREIVAAAAHAFKDKGLDRTKLGDIAAASGADRASLYYYVGSKEELFHEVVREAVLANLARAQAIRDGEGSAPEKLRELIESLMRSYAERYPILYVYIQENLNVPGKYAPWAEDMRQVNRDYEGVVIALVEQGIREGTVRSSAPAWVIAYGIMGMLNWTNRWYNPEDSSVSIDEIAVAFADTILQGIIDPKGARRTRSS